MANALLTVVLAVMMHLINGKMLRSIPGIHIHSVGDILHPLGAGTRIEHFVKRYGDPCILTTTNSHINVTCGNFSALPSVQALPYALGIVGSDLIVMHYHGGWSHVFQGGSGTYTLSNHTVVLNRYKPQHSYYMSSQDNSDDVYASHS